jgi:hypothetical protein
VAVGLGWIRLIAGPFPVAATSAALTLSIPGVTVEASSPVLIEKVRTVVTDGQGRFTIVNLRPGTYQLTFTLTGLNTAKREGLVLPADFTASVNVQLAIGTCVRRRVSPPPVR